MADQSEESLDNCKRRLVCKRKYKQRAGDGKRVKGGDEDVKQWQHRAQMVENKGFCYSIQLLLTALLWGHCYDSGKLTPIHSTSYHVVVRICPIGHPLSTTTPKFSPTYKGKHKLHIDPIQYCKLQLLGWRPSIAWQQCKWHNRSFSAWRHALHGSLIITLWIIPGRGNGHF